MGTFRYAALFLGGSARRSTTRAAAQLPRTLSPALSQRHLSESRGRETDAAELPSTDDATALCSCVQRWSADEAAGHAAPVHGGGAAGRALESARLGVFELAMRKKQCIIAGTLSETPPAPLLSS
jgi:hypothetical protein